MRSTFMRTIALLAVLLPLSAMAQARGAVPLPCDVLSAAEWGAVVGYTTTVTAGDNVCTYSGPDKSNGGQLRFFAMMNSSADAAASAKRMRGRLPLIGRMSKLSATESAGGLVFSVTFLRKGDADDQTAAQLEKLVAIVKQHVVK